MQELDMQVRAVEVSELQLKIAEWALISIVALFRSF